MELKDLKRKSSYAMVLLIALCCPVFASGTVNDVNTMTAFYIPLPHTMDCGVGCNQDIPFPEKPVIEIQSIYTLENLSELSMSDNHDIIFIMCPLEAQTLFSRPNFRLTEVVKEQLGKLTAECGIISDVNDIQTQAISENLKKIIDARLKIIQQYAQDPFVIDAVKKTEDLSMEKILKYDHAWISNTGSEYEKDILSNDISKFLGKKIRSNTLLYTEAFVCDRQGKTLGAYPRTSDYWQGDEDKFTKCMNGGETFIGPLEFDESIHSYSVQISVPVKDVEKTIGVLVVGLRNIK